MIKLNPHRALRRETATVSRGKTLVLALGPRTLTIRPKGARWRYEVDYESIFALGAKKEAERKRLERNKRPGGRSR